MTNAEAVQFLEERHAAFLATVADVDQATSQKQPAPGEWSVGEIVHHHLMIERTVRRLVRALRWRLLGEKTDDNHKPAALEKVSQRVGRVKTMCRFIPMHGQSLAQLLKALEGERKRTITLARRINLEKLRQRAFRHYILGALNGEEWLLFNGHHQERHRRQIEEVLERLKIKT
ncbi:MAG: DinB family protein [candidate division KSB1 bacterium]|nr:DinB family protein [candidate division KSB1 bacterium]MDZ7364268.1 DinB family protein [candidate division KSB1 bacterium]MDZ7404991.1 DinB family protein [candidate division KSB1 bacterium]